jgi:hypothetical protein
MSHRDMDRNLLAGLYLILRLPHYAVLSQAANYASHKLANNLVEAVVTADYGAFGLSDGPL